MSKAVTMVLALFLLAGRSHAGEPPRVLDDYALFALEELRSDSLHVVDGGVAVNAGLLFAHGPLRAPEAAVVGDVARLFPTSVCGALFTNRVARSASGCGDPMPFASPVIADPLAACGYPAPFPACDAARGVDVDHGETVALPGGTYGAVTVRGGGGNPGTLVLTGGAYRFCRLRTGRRAHVVSAAPATVEILGDLTLGNGGVTGTPDLPLDLFVDGGRVQVARNADVTARLCAPHAKLDVTQGATLRGRFLARVIRTDDVTVQGSLIPPPPTTSTTTVPTTSSTTTTPPTTTPTVPTTSSTTTTTSSTSTTTPSTTTTTTSTSPTTTTSTTTPSTTSSTTTTTTASTTTTTQPSAVCGNLVVEPGESCDDGNTTSNDACPSDCTIDPCAPNVGTDLPVDVVYAAPVGIGVAGIQLLLDYPEGLVDMSGSGGTQPAGTITDQVAAFSMNDFDHAARATGASATNFYPAGSGGRLFRVHFRTCMGAPAPVPGGFPCVVVFANDQDGNDVNGATCSVVLP